MRAQEYASWDNPRFAPMREPMRRVMEAYGNAEKWFADIKDRVLCDLPEFYLVWMAQKGFPKGKLGTLLATLYEIKVNGLEYLLKPLR